MCLILDPAYPSPLNTAWPSQPPAPACAQTAIKRVLKSWRAERVFTEGALGEIESALGVVDDMMMADGGDDAEPVLADDVIAQAPAGPTSTAAELRPDPRTTAAAAALPPPALLPAPECALASLSDSTCPQSVRASQINTISVPLPCCN